MGTKRIGLARTQALLENLKRELAMGGTKLIGTKTSTMHVDDTATTLTVQDSGKTIYWTKGTSHTITLPSALAGLNYKIVIKKSSNNEHKIATASGEYFYGQVLVLDNADDKHAVQEVVAATAAADPGDYDHLKIDGNANDTGSGVGSVIHLECLEDGSWFVRARLLTSGTPSSIATIYAG
jgi:hypothetical protein